jgi:hypothetical protein
MKLQDALDAVSTDGQPSRVYSEPYQTADGATIIAVSKIRGNVRDEVAVRARPIGVFVIHGGDVKWSPAVDPTPIALLGVLTGLIAATLATLAMVRRPPWPDIRYEGPLKALDFRRLRTN